MSSSEGGSRYRDDQCEYNPLTWLSTWTLTSHERVDRLQALTVSLLLLSTKLAGFESMSRQSVGAVVNGVQVYIILH